MAHLKNNYYSRGMLKFECTPYVCPLSVGTYHWFLS